MYQNELLNLYGAKVVEYVLALSYLVLFVFYWRWVQGGKAPGTVPDAVEAEGEETTEVRS